MSLPKWMENLKHCSDGPEHCDGCMQIPLTIQALSIAWEALESATKPKGRFSVDHEEHALNVIANMAGEAKEALRRIEEMGK